MFFFVQTVVFHCTTCCI